MTTLFLSLSLLHTHARTRSLGFFFISGSGGLGLEHARGSHLGTVGFRVDVEFATLLTLWNFTFVFFDTPTRCVLEIYLDRPPPSLLILESGSSLTSIPQHWLLLISPVRYVFFGFLSSPRVFLFIDLDYRTSRSGQVLDPQAHLVPPEMNYHHGCTHVRISPSLHHLTDVPLTSSQ